MQTSQKGILAEENKLGRYLIFSIDSADDVPTVLKTLADKVDIETTVIGIGHSLANLLGKDIPGLKTLAAQSGAGIEIPSTPAALWCWIRGIDRGEIYHRSRQIETMLMPAFVLNDVQDSFQYDNNHDLTGYEDGTENPSGNEAVQAAIVQGQGVGLDGGSFVATQQWLHDFENFNAISTSEQDNAIGRHIADNEEFDSAPESAHVKRSAQEQFSPEAFMLRRSMPWADGMESGLMFVAFGHSFNAFEAVMNKMLGKDDGISDALFKFTRPITGAYYWCPPIKGAKLDLCKLGI